MSQLWFWVVAMLFIPGFIFSVGCVSDSSTKAPEKGGAVLDISSDAFKNGSEIPSQYTCKGQNISPKLTWRGAPPNTKSFALIMDDPDAPGGTFCHWIIYNIPPNKQELASGIPASSNLQDGSRQGINDFRRVGYSGPCPPPGKPHRYFFHLYALNTDLAITGSVDRNGLLKAIEGHIIAKGDLMGLFRR